VLGKLARRTLNYLIGKAGYPVRHSVTILLPPLGAQPGCARATTHQSLPIMA